MQPSATQPPQQTPAGWYPDPENASVLRYWSGTEWTEARAPLESNAPPMPPTHPTPGTPPSNGDNRGNAWWRTPWALAAGGFLLGATLVAAGSGDEPAKVAAKPAKTVTATATATVTETVEIEKTVTAEPQAEPKKQKSAAGDSPGRAADTFVMPNEIGKNLQIAQDNLQEASGDPLFVSFSEDATGQDRVQILDSGWQVCSQKPAPGARVGLYDDVTFFVVRVSETCP